jgi:acyl-CoA thioester hydrolase
VSRRPNTSIEVHLVTRNIDTRRLALDNYPYQLQLETQYGDMDVHGHINNLAIGRFFESARSRAQLDMYAGRKLFHRDADYAILLVENNTRFLAECHFPDPVIVGSAIGHIGNSSYQILQGLFQHGICVALCDAALVCAAHGKPTPLADEVRQRMMAMTMRG